ncbi:hypothetical protein Tco_0957415 [Tanacetum coccineum]
MFNWDVVAYGKVRYHEDIDYFKEFKRDFPAIVFNNTVTTDHKISSEPTVSPLDDNQIDFIISFDETDDEDYTVIYDKKLFSYKIISINDLKTGSKNDNDEVNIPSNDVVVEKLDNGVDNIDTQSHEFDEDLETNHDIHRESFNIMIEHGCGVSELPLPAGTIFKEICFHGPFDENSTISYRGVVQHCWEEDFFGTYKIQKVSFCPDAVFSLGAWMWDRSVNFPVPAGTIFEEICSQTARFEEEVHGLRESLGEQREVLSGMSRDFVRFTTWTFGRLSQLLDAGGVTYTSYSDYQISYQRCTRWRTGEANTSAAPYIDDQPDP